MKEYSWWFLKYYLCDLLGYSWYIQMSVGFLIFESPVVQSVGLLLLLVWLKQRLLFKIEEVVQWQGYIISVINIFRDFVAFVEQ